VGGFSGPKNGRGVALSMEDGGCNGGGAMSWWELALSREPGSAGEFEVTVVAGSELGGNLGFEWFTRIIGN